MKPLTGLRILEFDGLGPVTFAGMMLADLGAEVLRLTRSAEAGPGDFIFVPPYVPHQEINASRDEVLECVLVRSDGEAVAINLDIEPVEKPETVLWIDPVHRDPAEK